MVKKDRKNCCTSCYFILQTRKSREVKFKITNIHFLNFFPTLFPANFLDHKIKGKESKKGFFVLYPIFEHYPGVGILK